MSFCPKCKSEYINGRTHCADCNSLLVETLEECENALENNVDNFPEESIVSKEDTQSVCEDAQDSYDDSPDSSDDAPVIPRHSRLYTSKTDQFKDYRSTGYIFLLAGIAGLTVITLNAFHVLSLFSASGASAILIYVVMYSMFGIFAFVGVNSFKNAGRIQQEAQVENQYLEELHSFIQNNINKDLFTGEEEGVTEEQLYFNRTAIIREKLTTQFPDIEESLLEKTIDEIYDNLFQ
ncbi:MAG: hypothetical protein ACI4AQ_03230 [Lachnospiraceae bacterium]